MKIDINILLVGNKVDLEDKREITKDMANYLFEKNNIKHFFESSAKTGFNAKNIFIEAAKVLYERHIKFKNRVSRPESLGFIDTDDRNNPYLENEDGSEADNKKSSCNC